MRSEPPLILVLDCAPTTLRFSVFDPGRPTAFLTGYAERLGTRDATIRFDVDGRRSRATVSGADHATALSGLVAFLEGRDLLPRVRAVGHRIVHGGERLTRSVEIGAEVLAEIEACVPLAPLHNPSNLIGVRAAMAALPRARQVAVFDTAFHRTMPPAAHLYGLPHRCRREFGIRRYGFHGSSLRFVAARAVDVLGLAPDDHGLLIVHLGDGASVTAIADGASLDTSMGLTPTEGLVMGTRCGDVDVGALLHLARSAGLDLDGIDDLVNRQSGLLGLSELSDDCRTLEAAAAEGHVGAGRALEVFVHRTARWIGGLATALARLDAIVFTGTIGETSAPIRSAVVSRLAILGAEIDEEANRSLDRGGGDVGRAGGPAILVIPTEEDRTIATDTAEIVFPGLPLAFGLPFDGDRIGSVDAVLTPKRRGRRGTASPPRPGPGG